MSKIRERLVGAGITVMVAGGAFWAVAAANADEVLPAEPTLEVTVTTESTEATIASLTARLVAAEWEILILKMEVVGLDQRIDALEK